jgi:hypothetical protein
MSKSKYALCSRTEIGSKNYFGDKMNIEYRGHIDIHNAVAHLARCEAGGEFARRKQKINITCEALVLSLHLVNSFPSEVKILGGSSLY